jgi:hypothetical protein
VLVLFEHTDNHYFSGDNWMPKDIEVLAIVKAMIERSDTFEPKLRKMLNQQKLLPDPPLDTDREYRPDEIVD